jgi:uncharacterized protein YjbI with pentapeptide repeats
MSSHYDKTFENQDFSSGIADIEFEACTFQNCSFENSEFKGSKFIDCEFIECNWSNAKLSKVSFQNAAFISCKMIGLQFDLCNPFNLSFEFNDSILNHSSFYGISMRSTQLINCQLQEVDFSEANLSSSLLKNCNLNGAIFDNSNLGKADFSMATNYVINPDKNRLKGAVFSRENLSGLLQHSGIVIT